MVSKDSFHQNGSDSLSRHLLMDTTFILIMNTLLGWIIFVLKAFLHLQVMFSDLPPLDLPHTSEYSMDPFITVSNTGECLYM